MKKFALLLVALAVAVSPATAATKKKQKEKVITNEAAQKMDPNEASGRFLRDALPLALPSWAIPIYFAVHKDDKK